jgi:hypothetical protein
MKKKLERPVLADGETTGHAHVLDTCDVNVFEMDNGTREFSLSDITTVKHEEHKPIDIPKGDWVSDKVMEYDHFAEEAKKVQD